MHFYEYAPIVVNVGIFVSGLMVAFMGNYFTFAKDLAYIKGQLDQVLKCHEDVTLLVEKHGKLESDFSKTATDLDKLYRKMKMIESRIFTTNQGGLL